MVVIRRSVNQKVGGVYSGTLEITYISEYTRYRSMHLTFYTKFIMLPRLQT
jgi:hypothetical protein